MPAPATRRPPPEAGAYAPRDPEQTVLYRVVAEHLETFLARARERDRRVPRFVEREFRRFLDCGIPAHGFLRVRCDACGSERLVPFSCKGRAFCPSCAGRRMADTAAHLVDRVFPRAPVRQWVLTVPWALRYRMAFDAGLTSDVLRTFTRALAAALRRRARRATGGRRRALRWGAVTFIQRFGSALNLNVHFHTLALDGVYRTGPDGTCRFQPVPPPDDAEVLRLTLRVARATTRLLEKRGLRVEADLDEVDPLARDEPLLAHLTAASVRGRIATGRRAGQAVLRFGDRIDGDAVAGGAASTRCAVVNGFSVHANVSVPANDRERLERLARYVARPPVATERLSRAGDGRLHYQLRRRWSDGTTAVVFEPLELIEKLAALVPPPRANTVRYHGLLAPAAHRRANVVPRPDATPKLATRHTRCVGAATAQRSSRPLPSPEAGTRAESWAGRPGRGDFKSPGELAGRSSSALSSRTRPRHYSWPELMRRVFAVDVLECPDCRGAMRILAAIHPPVAAPAILECLGLPARAPPLAPPRPEPCSDDVDDALPATDSEDELGPWPAE